MIHLTCTSCGAATDADHSRGAVCYLCVGRQVAKSDLAECARLLRKRMGWKGRISSSMDDQMTRVMRRAQGRIHKAIPARTVEDDSGQLVEDRSEAQTVYELLLREVGASMSNRGGVVVPRAGSLGRAIQQATVDSAKSRILLPTQ